MTHVTRHTAFDTAHPALAATYFCGMILLAMFSLQPVLVAISAAGALVFSFMARGVRPTLLGLRWQLPMVALVCLVNPLVSASGSTVLLRLGPKPIYLESLVYGAVMGTMLVSVVLWFEDAARVLTSDKVMTLVGRAMPVVALMASMTARLVPDLLRRSSAVRGAAEACSAVRPASASERTAGGVRLSGVLMGWALEDSLETADAMRARGWGGSPRRTSYQLYRFTSLDGVGLAAILVLLAVCSVVCWAATSQYAFYPTMSVLVSWWGYVAFALFALLPTILAVGEWARWRD